MELKILVDLILYGDNMMSIDLTKNAKSQHYIKYIDIQHHYIKKPINKKKPIIK